MGIDKQSLYGDYRDHQKRRNRLAMKAAYKSLDIPDDDVQIHSDNSKHGIGTLGAIGIAAVSGGIPAAMWLAGAFDKPEPPVVPPSPPAIVKPIEEPEQPEEKPPIIITEPGKTFDWRVGEPIVE